MRLCTKRRISELVNEGKVSLTGIDDINSVFLDDIRLGLTLSDNLVEICGIVDFSQIESVQYKKIKLRNFVLKPEKLYLGFSRERMSLSDDIMGLIFTRSKYARLGLEMANSSTFIIPGFGRNDPTPLTFEISARVEIKNLTSEEKYAYAVLFELDECANVLTSNYKERFPLNCFSEKNENE